MKRRMRTTPSMSDSKNTALPLVSPRPKPVKRRMRSVNALGSKINSPTDMPSEKIRVAVIMRFGWRSAKRSKRVGSSASASSSPMAASAENMSAPIPIFIWVTRRTTPRKNGTLKRLALAERSFTVTAISPEGSLTAIACLWGPSIRRPSIRACPPMLVRLQALTSSSFASLLSIITC